MGVTSRTDFGVAIVGNDIGALSCRRIGLIVRIGLRGLKLGEFEALKVVVTPLSLPRDARKRSMMPFWPLDEPKRRVGLGNVGLERMLVETERFRGVRLLSSFSARLEGGLAGWFGVELAGGEGM